MENWQTQMHEILGRRYVNLTKSLHWIGLKVSQIPIFSGFSQVKEFLIEYEIQVPSFQRFEALDVALQGALARWWDLHKKNIATWETY